MYNMKSTIMTESNIQTLCLGAIEIMERTDWNQRYIDSDTPWDCGTPSPELMRFLEERKLKPCRMLEVGCGTGTNAVYLAQLGFEVTAVDLSEVALDRARAKSKDADVSIKFIQADITSPPELGGPFPFVFDRGTYHIVRSVNLTAFQKTLAIAVQPDGLYFVLAGNANTDAPPDRGPPTVRAQDLCGELESDSFDLLQLKETNFHGVMIEGKEFAPLAWSALLKRRKVER
jgi:methyl halide transferase